MWLQKGLQIMRMQPLRLLILGLLLQFIAGVSQVGVLGVLFIVAVPVFSAGMLQAMDAASRGQRPALLTLFAAFREGHHRLPRLLLLGALGLGCAVVAVGLAVSGSLANLDPALLARLEAGDVTVLEDLDPAFISRVLFGMAAGLLAGGCLSYYAVPLIWFFGLPLGRAITRGLMGLVRQWRALLVLGVVLGLVSVPVVLLAAYTLSTQATGGVGAPALSLLMLLAGVFYQLLLFASQLASFSSVFGTHTPRSDRESPEDQLVA